MRVERGGLRERLGLLVGLAGRKTPLVIGTLVNAVGIVLGAAAGLSGRVEISPATQLRLRNVLAAATVLAAVATAFPALASTPGGVLRQGTIACFALVLGHLTGRVLRLQSGLTRLAAWAAHGAPAAAPTTFAGPAVFLAANPLGWIGATVEGVGGPIWALGVKAVLDGLAVLAFAPTLGRTTWLLWVPVVAVQGMLSSGLLAMPAEWRQPELLASVQIMGALLIMTTVLVILGVRRIPLVQYLPALGWAPLLTSWWQ